MKPGDKYTLIVTRGRPTRTEPNAMSTPKRYYLIRTPRTRSKAARYVSPLRSSSKRHAISSARRIARLYKLRTPVRNRRISVYTVDPGKRPSLLFQCHWNRTTGKIVSEVL